MATRNWQQLYKPAQRYVLLDRDGVINRRVPAGYVTSWEQFEFLPRTLDALRLFAENDHTALIISNQACVGKGLLSSSELDAITKRFLLEAALSGANIAQVYYCRHSKEDRCSCRKPQPGLILRAQAEHGFPLEDTFFIGDSLDDMAAASSAGCPGILIRRDAFLEKHANDEQHAVTCNLWEAAQIVVSRKPAAVSPHYALVRQ